MHLHKFKKELLIYLVVFVIQCIPCLFYSVPVIVDEVNPLSFGFWLRGEEWTNYLVADGYYYKYGQLLLYLPFVLLIKNPIILYKVLLIVNTALISLIPIFVYRILNIYLEVESSYKAFLISVLVAILPQVFLNSKFVWAETHLLLLSWIIIFLIMKCIKNNRNSEKILISAGLGVVSVYGYMVHTRGIVLFVATFIIIFMIRILWGKKNISIVSFITVSLVMLWIDSKIAIEIKKILYGNFQNLAGLSTSFINEDYFKSLFSYEGMKVFLSEIAGWLFSCAISTYGLSVFAFMVGIGEIKNWFRKVSEVEQRESVIFTFFMLCFLGGLLLGCLFFYPDITVIINGSMIRRGDKLIYTRYLDVANVGLCFFALYFIFVKREQRNFYKEKIFTCLLINMLLLFFAASIAPKIEGTITWTQILQTVDYFCNLNDCDRGGEYTVISNLCEGIIGFGIFAILIMTVLFFFRREEKKVFVFFAIVLLVGNYWNSYNVKNRMDNYAYNTAYSFYDILANLGEDEYKVVYLDDDVIRCSFQYVYYDYYVVTKRDENIENINNFFVISKSGEYNVSLYENDYFEIENAVTDINNYHIYIKGEELNRVMQEYGYQTKTLYMDSLLLR